MIEFNDKEGEIRNFKIKYMIVYMGQQVVVCYFGDKIVGDIYDGFSISVYG